MAKIIIIGEGNVGTHLAKAFSQAGLEVKSLAARRFTADDIPADAKVAIIAVHDAHISDCAAKLSNFNGIVAHTSGGSELDALSNVPMNRRAVFYPLQTFTKEIHMDYREIPFFIEAADPEVTESLMTLARKISPHVREADSITRCRLHIAAVFACNFTNHLWALAYDYLKQYGLEFSDLMPLIIQTVAKINDGTSKVDPADMQTGPAVRNDLPTIQRHLTMLTDRPDLDKLYRTLTDSIAKYHNPDDSRGTTTHITCLK